MQFELHALCHLVGYGVAITLLGTIIGQFCQIVSLELDAVDLVVASQFLDLLLTFFRRQGVLTVLVACKLFVELLFSELLPPFFFCTKRLGDGEEGHDWIVIEAIDLYLV